ncbi:MAG: hypothetical protein JWQ68_677 [Cryobacterium sp.]|jgi:hypothetical protein|nr:hypothetical protein [Cryobacterium sp.]
MKRTTPSSVTALALVGLVLGFLLEVSATAAGTPIVVPPLTLPFTLVAIGIIVVALAWPIRKATKGGGKKRVDPFLAMRVAVLAKSSSLSGSLLLGAGIGITLYLLTRSVVPAVASVWLAIATALGSAVLLGGGLVAEHFCTLPPDDDQEEPGAARV